jgi:hypothetical protein
MYCSRHVGRPVEAVLRVYVTPEAHSKESDGAGESFMHRPGGWVKDFKLFISKEGSISVYD